MKYLQLPSSLAGTNLCINYYYRLQERLFSISHIDRVRIVKYELGGSATGTTEETKQQQELRGWGVTME